MSVTCVKSNNIHLCELELCEQYMNCVNDRTEQKLNFETLKVTNVNKIFGTDGGPSDQTQ